MIRRKLLQALASTVFAAALPAAQAQKPVELTFYYPVAVGGPVTKTIDQMAADFEKFYKDGNKDAGTRVRLAMQELKTFAQTVRNEVQSIKNEGKSAPATETEAAEA